MSKEITIKTKQTVNSIFIKDCESDIPIVFLHGFTGSHKSWDQVVSKLKTTSICVDLPGHAGSTFKNLSNDYNIEKWVEDFNDILNSIGLEKITLCGYSMGARLALAYASRYPMRIKRLFLESVSYGIKKNHQRHNRLEDDITICRNIENNYLEFVNNWENNPLFINQADRNLKYFLKQRKDRLSHNPKQLSKALYSFSQGNMKCYLSKFSKLPMKTIVINGAEDLKYVQIGKEILKMNKNINHCIVHNCGHNIHIEKSDKFIELLNT